MSSGKPNWVSPVIIINKGMAMCKVGESFILCCCATGAFDKTQGIFNANPYWQLFRLAGSVQTSTGTLTTSSLSTQKSSSQLTLDDDGWPIESDFDLVDDMEMVVGDVVVPAIMDSPTYQSFCDALNSRSCFDAPIVHKNQDMLVIYFKGDEYRYCFFDTQWHPMCLGLNEPKRALNSSGKVEGVGHFPPFKVDYSSVMIEDTDDEFAEAFFKSCDELMPGARPADDDDE